ncbi:MAG: tRNA 2-thiouridine(34) synthase MnmA [Deltaproteobacteria bacterium]|nr:tRNA 2-thiouridine(34) synthase MnmA [Deltaproteobacteria bacterium]
MSEPRRRIVVAMSGGVDSSVAAAMLARGPDEVIGVTLCLRPPECTAPARSCCGTDDLAMARRVADRLGIPHYLIDARDEFEARVLQPAWTAYAAGRTPNPCVLCNQQLKFGRLLAQARTLGAEAVATGHHARIDPAGEGRRPVLRRGHDRRKDQSYFLFALTPEQLRAARTPIGGMTKDEVRARAAELGLPNAARPGSRDACLAARDGSFAEALRELFGGPQRPGRIVDVEGRVLGEHRGCHRFTVGQRHRLGVALGRRAYVVELRPERDEVVVGGFADLECDGVVASGVRWLVEPPRGPLRVLAQTRYRMPVVEAEVRPADGEGAEVLFERRAAGVAPGQAVVFYEGDRVLGGGWIERRIV